MSASPIGVPGCPDFAFSTASTARKRIVLTQSSSRRSFEPIFGSLLDSAVLIAAAALVSVMQILRRRGVYSAKIREILQRTGGLGMPVDDSVTVKGSPVRSLQKFIDAELTEQQKEQVFAALPAEYATRFRSPI